MIRFLLDYLFPNRKKEEVSVSDSIDFREYAYLGSTTIKGKAKILFYIKSSNFKSLLTTDRHWIIEGDRSVIEISVLDEWKSSNDDLLIYLKNPSGFLIKHCLFYNIYYENIGSKAWRLYKKWN